MSAHVEDTAPLVPLERFRAGGRTMRTAALVGAGGLLLTLIDGIFQPQRALASYLTAFVYCLGISVGGLILVMSHNAARARWMVVLRRAMETVHASLPLFAVLFLPVLLGASAIFPWVRPPASMGKEGLAVLAHKRAYLNLSAFTVRAAVYFAVFVAVSFVLYRWSNEQDTAEDPVRSARLTRLQRALSAGGLPIVAFAFTFAGFDWLMSASPLWFSTIFGVYYFAGSFLSAIAAVILFTFAVQGEAGTHGPLVSRAHYHSLGKLLLAFVAFWAYVAFSQFMLIWIANLPEEIPWYIVRTRGPWRPVFWFLILFHFIVPFFLLLSRELKLRPRALAALAGWLLFAHYVDVWWVMEPSFSPGTLSFHWTEITALAGVGGITVAFALFQARGRYPVPVGDPYLSDSLRYSQP